MIPLYSEEILDELLICSTCWLCWLGASSKRRLIWSWSFTQTYQKIAYTSLYHSKIVDHRWPGPVVSMFIFHPKRHTLEFPSKCLLQKYDPTRNFPCKMWKGVFDAEKIYPIGSHVYVFIYLYAGKPWFRIVDSDYIGDVTLHEMKWYYGKTYHTWIFMYMNLMVAFSWVATFLPPFQRLYTAKFEALDPESQCLRAYELMRCTRLACPKISRPGGSKGQVWSMYGWVFFTSTWCILGVV